MRALLLNMFLGFIWVAITGDPVPSNFLFGLVLGWVLLMLFSTTLRVDMSYTSRIPKLLNFIWFFAKELTLSNLRVAFDVIAFSERVQPAIVAIPLNLKTDVAITTLANMITLTPGTLSLHVGQEDGKKVLFVHTMYLENGDVDAFRQSIIQDYERRVGELLEPNYRLPFKESMP